MTLSPVLHQVLRFHGGNSTSIFFEQQLNDISLHFPPLIRDYLRGNGLEIVRFLDTIRGRFHSFAWPIQVCLVLNIVVFLAWQIVPERIMIENFMDSRRNLAAKRYWTLFTYAFSHCSLGHLLVNMACLMTIGPALLQKMRPKVLFGVVASSSIVAGVFTSLFQPFRLIFWPQQYRADSVGHWASQGSIRLYCVCSQ